MNKINTKGPAMRECIGPFCLDKENKLFKSDGIHNRKCPRCSNQHLKEALPIRNMTQLPKIKDIPGGHFFKI